MDLGGTITRGRPAGKLTIRRRQVLEFVLRCEAKGEVPPIGVVVRVCKLNCRQDAKRILKDLRGMGLVR